MLGLYLPPVKRPGSAEVIQSAPDNHFRAGPDRGLVGSGIRRIYGTRKCPTICAGIVFSTGIQGKAKGINAAPDNHFAAIPHRAVIASVTGRVCGADSSPSVRSRIVSPAGSRTPDNHFIAGPHCRTPACVPGLLVVLQLSVPDCTWRRY